MASLVSAKSSLWIKTPLNLAQGLPGASQQILHNIPIVLVGKFLFHPASAPAYFSVDGWMTFLRVAGAVAWNWQLASNNILRFTEAWSSMDRTVNNEWISGSGVSVQRNTVSIVVYCFIQINSYMFRSYDHLQVEIYTFEINQLC
jgi:hypothetical protein